MGSDEPVEVGRWTPVGPSVSKLSLLGTPPTSPFLTPTASGTLPSVGPPTPGQDLRSTFGTRLHPSFRTDVSDFAKGFLPERPYPELPTYPLVILHRRRLSPLVFGPPVRSLRRRAPPHPDLEDREPVDLPPGHRCVQDGPLVQTRRGVERRTSAGGLLESRDETSRPG